MIPMLPQPTSDAPWYRRTATGFRHPIQWLEALTGQFYLAVLVAGLVGALLSQKSEASNKG